MRQLPVHAHRPLKPPRLTRQCLARRPPRLGARRPEARGGGAAEVGKQEEQLPGALGLPTCGSAGSPEAPLGVTGSLDLLPQQCQQRCPPPVPQRRAPPAGVP